MEQACKIIRRSIHSFFCSYNTSASLATICIFPASAAALLSGALAPSSGSIQAISRRLMLLFEAAHFPANSRIFELLGIKLSQTIFSYLFTLPFALTFLCLSKASIVQTAREFPRCRHGSASFSSFLHLYPPLLTTHLLNSFVILSANATIFSVLFMAFGAVDLLGLKSSSFLLVLTSAGTILYSTIVANALVTCNLASIISAMENCGSYTAILKACLLIRGRTVIALSLALPTNLGMGAIEALFQIRVMRPYSKASSLDLSIVWEAITITYMYSILSVLDIIISCFFYKSCKYEILAKYGGRIDQIRGLDQEKKVACAV